MIEIPWELNISNGCALLKNEKIVKKTPAKLKTEAVERMIGVSLVSAEFEGAPKVFEPKMWVLLNSGGSVEFIGLYVSAFISDGGENLPSLCVRRGTWEKSIPVDLFNTEFFFGDAGVISTHFFNKNSVKNLISQLNEIEIYVLNGLKMVDSLEKEKKDWESVRLFINANILSLEIEYSPQIKSENNIEDFLKNITDCLNKIGTDGIVPDEGSHRISYKETVLNQFLAG